MRTRQNEMREKVREKLANYAGIGKDELVLTRNTTESMNIIIQGIKLEEGDEILRTNLEYPNIIQALDMRERRFGTKIRIVDVPIHPISQDEIIEKVIGAANKKTKVILISHMVFLNGQEGKIYALIEIIESIKISKDKCNDENLRTLNKILKIEG